MSARARGRWISAVVAATLLVGIGATLNVARSIGAPFLGAVIYRNHYKNVWQVEPATPPWWPAIAAGQLRYDDVVLALDGRPYGPDSGAQLLAAAGEGHDTVRARVSRGEGVLDVDLPLSRFTPAQWLDIVLPELVNGLGLWFLAVALLRARPEETVNQVFAATFALVAAGIWGAFPGLFVDSDLPTRLLQLVWVPTFCICGSTFVHLTLFVPEPMARMPRRTIALLYAYAALMSIAYMAGLVLWWSDPEAPYGRRLTAAANGLHHVFLVGTTIFCAGRLVGFFFRRDLSRRLRRQVNILIPGLALCIPYIVIKVLRTAGIHGHFWNGLDLRFTILPLPICMAFLILRYQTFQRAHPAIGGVMVLGTSAFLASVGAWLLRLVDPQWMSSVAISPFLALFGVALVASVLWSMERFWRNSIARLFDWDRRSYAAARQFGQEVVGQDDLRKTPSAIVAALVDKMELEQAALWLWDPKDRALSLAAHAGTWTAPPVARLVPDALFGQSPPVRLPSEGLPEWLRPLRGEGGVEVGAPLWASGRLIGLLGLGKRWDDEIFDERDMEIVDLIAQQAALFLLTAAQIDELRQVPHQIAQTQERERFKIAQELHDTVQQFLGRLPFYLEVSRDAARQDPAEAEAILERCLTDVEAAAQTVREIRANLAPLQLERSLTLPLRRLVEHFQSRSGLATEISIENGVEDGLALEARHALYRVVQQALDNVAAHAQASRACVAVDRDGPRVAFQVADDGRGFGEAERARAAERGSFGLTSMHARITSLGGELTLESPSGGGTRVRGWLPASFRSSR
jgi:signal transduction histidine kinase